MGPNSDTMSFDYEVSKVMHASGEVELVRWYQSMGFFTLVGVGVHLGYALIRKDDGGNGFASSVSTAIFLLNWIGMHFDPHGIHPLSMGVLAGACAGYEIYACLNEVLNLLKGVVRHDMILHHGLCLVFIGFTGYMWGNLPQSDIVYWAFVWESIALTLASNVALNLRTFCIAQS